MGVKLETTFLAVLVLGGIAFSVVAVLRSLDSGSRRKYGATIAMLEKAVSPVDRLADLKNDAWGRPFVTTTNTDGIVNVRAHGRNPNRGDDDIRLMYLPWCGSYTVL